MTIEQILKDVYHVDEYKSKMRGFVFMCDEEGNVIQHNENMIVKSGREAIMKSIMTGKKINFTQVALTDDGVLTTEVDNYTDKVQDHNNKLLITIDGTNSTLEPDNAYSAQPRLVGTIKTFTEEDNEIIPIAPAQSAENSANLTIASLCLVGTLVGYNSGNPFLFSRVVFQPYEKSMNTNLEFKYYIYF